MRIAVQVAPNAKRTEVLGVLNDALKIRLQAQPIEGKANDALVKFLADALGVSRRSVTLTHGLTNQRKRVEIAAPALTVAAVEAVLLGHQAGKA